MKKILAFIYIMMAVMAAQSQVVTLKFVGADRTGQDYVRLHHVSVYDHDQLWHQVIYYPDTTLALYQNGTVGIVETMYTSSLQLYQNTPNPFTGTTDVNLTTADAGDVTLEIVDGNGKTVGTHRVRPEIGTHQFRISLNAAGTYVMTARQNGKTSSIKMVCNGGGGGNSITHVGTIGNDGTITLFLKNGMSDGSYPFRLGDRMEFIGYAMIDETERVSETVTCNQGYASDYSLKFDVARPEVTTFAATDVTATNAIWHGEVTADNNALVTERGFCWVAGDGTPTLANDHLAVGDGLGSFDVEARFIASLQPATTYLVRAYAVNAVGISYGETKAFTTNDTLPEVTTLPPTNVSATAFTCGGNVVAMNSATLSARGVCWNTTGNPTIADSHTTDGTTAGSFTSSVTGLEPATQYYVRAYATNAVGTAYGEIYTVTTLNDIPIVVTAEVGNIAARTAQCGGEVVNDHGAAVTERGVCWNTTGNPTIADSYTTDGSGLGEFASTLNLLTPHTPYYVRAYATNSVGTAYGEVRAFTTLCDLPEVTTTSPSNISSTTFTCGGDVIAINCDNLTARGVCWNTTGNPTVADSHTTDGTTAGSFISGVTGLEPATQYYVRAYATNAVGTGYGEIYTVTTLNDIPIVVTAEVSDIDARTAQCGGEVVNEHGAAVTERGVCWNTTGNPTIADSYTTDGSGLGEFASTLNSLTPNTQFYVRAYATNSVGTAYGEERSFTTLCELPEVTTMQPTDVASTSFTCGGDVIAINCATLTARGVCWNTTGNPTVADSRTTNGTAAGSFTSSVTELEPATQYYVRAYATNSTGTAYGETYTLTTLNDIPLVHTADINDIAIHTAQCGGEVVNEHGATVIQCGVCWSTTGNPTIADNYSTDGNGLGEFTSTLNELTPNTQYYVRAYATNSAGTAYGEERSFTTLCDLPEVTTEQPTNVSATSFTGGGNVTAINCDTLTARGVCWNTTGDPTVADSHTTDDTSAGIFTSSIMGLECETTYYLRAYATNSVGTGYGEIIIVTTIEHDVPEVTTISATIYNGLNAIVNVEVISENCDTVTTRGVCYSTSQNPTINDLHTAHSAGMGAFADTLTQLDRGTTYYVRPYATNNVGTAYGEELSVTTPTRPIVYTTSVTNITSTTASCGGDVTDDGGSTVTTRGVCWSTSSYPTVSDSHTTDGNGTGSFTSNLTNLAVGTTYYVRAYATNSAGTAYGSIVSFSTPNPNDGQPCTGNPTITDASGNTYNTVWIGTQCWMKENLRTKKYANGTTISQGNSTSTTTAYWYYPDSSSSNMYTYGLLYNWKAVMGSSSSSNATPSGVQGICPDGWHVPSNADWSRLINYVSSQSQYMCGSTSTDIAKALAGTMGWNSDTNTCSVGNMPSNNNTTGFSALPAGYYNGSYNSFGNVAYFWSATMYGTSSNTAYYRSLSYSSAVVGGYHGNKGLGFSVRCVRYVSDTTIPTVRTAVVSDVTPTTAVCGGNITDNGGVIVTSRGICWSTNSTPTISDSHTTDGEGSGSFTSNLTGLTPNTTYYVRAYATNSVGTAYGSEVSFNTSNPNDGQSCPGTPTLTDIDGNIYNTVVIGTQCWMKENLRAKKFANGTSISQGSSTSTTTAYWYYPNNSSSNMSTYGLLYNWKAVMSSSSSSNANPSGVQGICPTGWHVPSYSEWRILSLYVKSYSQFLCSGSGNISPIAKALASTTGWSSSTGTCDVGNMPSNNNATGFSALPAGGYSGSYGNVGYSANFWSATQYSSSEAYGSHLYNSSPTASTSYGNKNLGYSVRCVRDELETTIPTVTTAAVSDITSTTATCGGNVIPDVGVTVTARGVCWSTNSNPTISDSHTTNGNGTGIFTSVLTDLTPNTTYYVRAYATNSVGTAYGGEVSFITPNGAQLCPGTPTLTDIDSNVYNTVLIGTQCWMKENLRTTKYADNTPITQGSSTSTTTAYWYYPNNNASNMPTYGLLYNWAAVMRDASSSSANPSGVQGICPTGWHVPSDAEWKQMEMAVGMSQSDADNMGYRGNIAARLCGNTGWTSSSTANAAGNTSAVGRNSSGFSALPAGTCLNSYYDFGSDAYFWSSTDSSTHAYYRSLNYSDARVTRYANDKRTGLSVRCVKD